MYDERLAAAYGEIDRLRYQMSAALVLVEALGPHADRLRETADELRRGTIHPAHAANRITKIADEIARRKE